MRSHTLAWSKKNGQDAAILVAIAALAILVLTIRLEGVSSGGDAIYKWNFVRQWFYKNDFTHAKWDHHMARFGVNSIAYLVQLIVGRGPNAYFVAPVGAGVVQAIFVYACAKRIGGRFTGVISALALIFFKDTARATSQLLPEVFSGTYAIVAIYLYLRYADATGRRRTGWLVAMSLMLFWDYLAKETSVFFLPGFAIALWLSNERFRPAARDILILTAVFAAGVLLETSYYRLFTQYPHRFAMVVENHIPGDNAREAKNFWGLFKRYDHLFTSWKFALYFCVAACFGIVAFARDFRSRACIAIGVCYYFFLTFLVRSIHPIILWQAFHPRYLDPTIPIVILLDGLFFSQCILAIVRQHSASGLLRRLAPVARFPATVAVVVIGLLGAYEYAEAKPEPAKDVLAVNTQMSLIANNAYRRNLPIVSTGSDKRGVWVVYAVLIDDKRLVRRGILPAYDDVKITEGRRDYILRNPEYDWNGVFRLIQAGCAVQVKTSGGNPADMRPMTLLPPECDKELDAVVHDTPR